MFRALEAEQTAQLGNFKREIHQELKDTLVAINQSISQFTGNTDKSTKSTSLNNDLDVDEMSVGTIDHDNDAFSIDDEIASPVRPSQFETRVRNLDKLATKVADKQQEIVEEDGSKTSKLVLNLNLSDKGKEEKKEEDFDRNSLSLKKVVQSRVPTSSYRSFFCDEAVLDLKKEKEDISSAAANWAAASFDSKVPDKSKFHEGMWAIVAEGYGTKCEGVIERGDNKNVHEVLPEEVVDPGEMDRGFSEERSDILDTNLPKIVGGQLGSSLEI